ncbi:MAG: PaaI family thioesterase [Actinobacteria bacterium]|nr:MAG: PaaI family thioesterase [Actinomycetota bacterium]
MARRAEKTSDSRAYLLAVTLRAMPDRATDDDEFRPLPSHYRMCFGCGEEHPTGLHMKVFGSKDRVVGSFLVTEHHQGAPGLAHGGVIAAAVDEAMGFLIYLLAAPAVTVHLEVDYRKPVPVGSVLELETHVEKIDGRKVYAVLTGRADGVVHVEASSIYVKVTVEHFRPHYERQGEKLIRPYNP